MRFLPSLGVIMDFSGKYVLISGGSSGIGLSVAKQMAEKGAHLTLLARRKNLLGEAALQIKEHVVHQNQLIEIISADVSNYENLRKSLTKVDHPIDILINSAGVAYPGIFMEMEPDIFKNVMEINYLGTVNLTKLVVPGMIAQKSGYIVNISSLAALIGIYGYTAYAPSKFAVRGFSHCLRAELIPFGIDVSIVYPPDTDTPQLAFERSRIPEITKKINEGGGMLSPDKVAEVIIQGIEKKKFVIIPGFEGKVIYRFAALIDTYMYKFAVRIASRDTK
jgi:3-dehydrosphinganine reductase